MQIDEFVRAIKMRYPSKQSDSINAMMGDIRTKLESFKPEDIQTLYDLLIDNYTLNRTPRWADINRIANDNGIGHVNRFVLKNFYNVCDVCGTAYSANSTYCPKCHDIKPFTVHLGEPENKRYMNMQEDCGKCIHYDSRTKGNYGPVCPDFGTEKWNKTRECVSCECKKCCYETLAIRLGESGDRAMFDSIGENEWEKRINENNKTTG